MPFRSHNIPLVACCLRNSTVIPGSRLRRHYATPTDLPPGTQPPPPELIWPSHPNPTPYDIFNYTKGAPYSKRRYYDLCMLYHPDRYCSVSHHHKVSEAIRNDRFKLIVAANEVLSDPKKKWAYDRYGAGWNGQVGVQRWDAFRHANNPRSSTASTFASEADTRPWWQRVDWSGREGREGGFPDPHTNATWEDWERYYSWRDGTTSYQQLVFTSNATFVAFVMVFALVGGLATVNHAQASGRIAIEQRDKLHEEIARDVERRRRDAEQLGDREERVRNFLRMRDPAGVMNELELKGEKYRKLLPTTPQSGIAGQRDGQNRDSPNRGGETKSGNSSESRSSGAGGRGGDDGES